MSTENERNANGQGTGDADGYHVRVRVEMVLEIADPDEVIRAAWARLRDDEQLPEEEREAASRSVAQDPAEAVTYLIDPDDLLSRVPGVVLSQASWSSEPTDYDPDDEWDAGDDTDDYEDDLGNLADDLAAEAPGGEDAGEDGSGSQGGTARQ